MSRTLVTSLFDLNRREPGSTRRPVDVYVEHAAAVLNLDCPLVIYCDPELLLRLQSLRTVSAFTKWVPIALEKLQSYKLLPRLFNVLHERPDYQSKISHKDSPLYHIVGWSKLELLRRTILDTDVPSTTHYAWIDMGLAHAVGNLRGIDTLPLPSSVRILQICPHLPNLFNNLVEYFSKWRAQVAGGWFVGPRDAILHLCDSFDRILDELLSQQIFGLEDMTLAYVNYREPQLQFYYGDYKQIVTNYLVSRENAEIVLNIVRTYRLQALNQKAYDVLMTMVASDDNGRWSPLAAMTPNQLIDFYDELIISHYYINRRDPLATLGRLLVEVAELIPAAREYVMSRYDHFARNLSCVPRVGGRDVGLVITKPCPLLAVFQAAREMSRTDRVTIYYDPVPRGIWGLASANPRHRSLSETQPHETIYADDGRPGALPLVG